MISRRSLFALFGGAAAAPLVKAIPAEDKPAVEYYDGWDVIGTGYCGGGSGGIERFGQAVQENVTRNNVMLLKILERKMVRAADHLAAEMNVRLYDD